MRQTKTRGSKGGNNAAERNQEEGSFAGIGRLVVGWRREGDSPLLPLPRLLRGLRLHDPRRAGRGEGGPSPRLVEQLEPGGRIAQYAQRRRRHVKGRRSCPPDERL